MVEFFITAIKVVAACAAIWLMANLAATFLGSPEGSVDNCSGSGYMRDCD